MEFMIISQDGTTDVPYSKGIQAASVFSGYSVDDQDKKVRITST